MENWFSRLWAHLPLKKRKTNPTIKQKLACKEVVELVTEYLEGALLPEQRAQLEEHLADCPGCRNYMEQVRLTISMLYQIRLGSVQKGRPPMKGGSTPNDFWMSL